MKQKKKGEVNINDNTGRSLLHHVVSCNNIELVKQLFELGADPNDTRSKYGITFVCTVVAPHTSSYRLEIPKLFIEYGVNVNSNRI